MANRNEGKHSLNIPWPKEWTGSNPLAAWINRLLRRCKQEVCKESKDLRRIDGPDGYYLELKIQGGGGKGKTLDANYKPMIITGLGSSLAPPRPDLLICKAFAWGASAGTGADIYVAKDPEARQNPKEYYPDDGDNTTVTYTYFGPSSADPSFGDNFRMATDGTNTELQVMEKRYLTQTQFPSGMPVTQAVILVVDTGLPTGVTDPTGASVTRIETKPVRVWVRYATQ